MSDDKYTGDVLWFDPKRGFGFIGWDMDGVKQKDLFVHFSDIVCEGFKTLIKDQKVSFGLGKNNRGDPKAIDVNVLKH
ncbi:CspC Cold shock proteins [uncultured Caudovirales phage]|uniref:CspC Cold shock proteins n=1 Tax=uncultured Caudovirales phage TaxID=2100421 RepID=A0A6J5RU89_9CAUD|nr:CspC Cold shock proteins [uncultured Caudovirales phage]